MCTQPQIPPVGQHSAERIAGHCHIDLGVTHGQTNLGAAGPGCAAAASKSPGPPAAPPLRGCGPGSPSCMRQNAAPLAGRTGLHCFRSPCRTGKKVKRCAAPPNMQAGLLMLAIDCACTMTSKAVGGWSGHLEVGDCHISDVHLRPLHSEAQAAVQDAGRPPLPPPSCRDKTGLSWSSLDTCICSRVQAFADDCRQLPHQ